MSWRRRRPMESQTDRRASRRAGWAKCKGFGEKKDMAHEHKKETPPPLPLEQVCGRRIDLASKAHWLLTNAVLESERSPVCGTISIYSYLQASHA